MKHVLALDEGTTSARAIVVGPDGSVKAVAQKEFAQIYRQPGWVEHDALEIWSAQAGVAAEAMSRAGIATRDVAAIGITNQRETTVIWDRTNGTPITNAIVWQDRRTAGECDRLRACGAEEFVRQRTGLVLDSYFSATKIAWLLDHIPGARANAEAGRLAFGTIDTWLIWKLTNGRLHITDVSNASRTMLLNIYTCDWDDELLELFRVPRSILPEVRASSEVYGDASSGLGLKGAPIAGVVGDQQAALFGQLCTQSGLTKNTYGTGCFLLQNIGDKPIQSKNRLLTTVAWKLANATSYALEGNVFIAGAVIQWLRDGLQIIRSSEEINLLAATVEDNGGVFLVPAFVGLGAPHWDPQARGTIVGLTRGTTAGHIARAALESIAFQTADLFEAMRADIGRSVAEVRVDGGASKSDLLMQFQANVLGVPVERPTETETTALGAAYLAGLAVGVWESPEEISAYRKVDRRFEPGRESAVAQASLADWRRAVERAKGWVP